MNGVNGLITIREVAAALKLSQRAVWSMLQNGRFGPEVIRLGRAVRFRADELHAWIAASCPKRADWTAKPQAGEMR